MNRRGWQYRRPRRELVAQAITRAHNGEKGAVVIIDKDDPPNSVSIDATLLILKKIEIFRSRFKRAPQGAELRALVTEVAFSTDFDSGRRYAYEVVIMNYYGILKEFMSRIRRMRGIPRARRIPRRERVRETLVLT